MSKIGYLATDRFEFPWALHFYAHNRKAYRLKIGETLTLRKEDSDSLFGIKYHFRVVDELALTLDRILTVTFPDSQAFTQECRELKLFEVEPALKQTEDSSQLSNIAETILVNREVGRAEMIASAWNAVLNRETNRCLLPCFVASQPDIANEQMGPLVGKAFQDATHELLHHCLWHNPTLKAFIHNNT